MYIFYNTVSNSNILQNVLSNIYSVICLWWHIFQACLWFHHWGLKSISRIAHAPNCARFALNMRFWPIYWSFFKSKESVFPIVVIFFPGCVWGGCATIFFRVFHIYPGKAVFLFPLRLRSLWCVQMMGYILASMSYVLFAHYTISLVSLYRLVWRHLTYKMSVRCILSSMCLILYQLSKLFSLWYMGIYVFAEGISFVMILRISVYFILSSTSSSNRQYESIAII